METPIAQETATLWRRPEEQGFEFLKVSYLRRAYPRHTHDHFVIGLVERGVEAFAHGNRILHATPGDISLVNPEDVHTGGPATEAGYLYRAIYPAASSLLEYCRKFSSAPIFAKPVVRDLQLYTLLLRLHRAAELPCPALERDTGMAHALSLLLSRHADSRAPLPPVRPEPALVRRTKEYLKTHIAEDVRLADLARQSSVTPQYLVRAFMRHVGPPHAYHLQLRIDLARRLLQGGMRPSEVAIDAGFFDQSHLNRHFTRILGVSAGRYRKLISS